MVLNIENNSMRSLFTTLIFLALLLSSACSANVAASSPTSIPTNTVEATRTPSPTSTPAPTSTRHPTSAPMPTPIVLSDPRIAELESSGYSRDKYYGEGKNTPPQITQGNLSYIQYVPEARNNCVLIFTVLENGQIRVLSIVDASTINQRIYNATIDPAVLWGCFPSEWGDMNQNGNPDIAVQFYWGGRLGTAEIHIFEVDNELKVTNLTGDLPGMISPDWFDPSGIKLTVIDDAWFVHDCIYPLMFVYWVYDWKDRKYTDITPGMDMSSYLDERKGILTAQFGQPFAADRNIGRLTELLIMYDKMGQREQGWQEYLNLTDLKNWPGTDAENAAWLKSDLEHFQEQYNSKQPFTPNNYRCAQ